MMVRYATYHFVGTVFRAFNAVALLRREFKYNVYGCVLDICMAVMIQSPPSKRHEGAEAPGLQVQTCFCRCPMPRP
jgi:hypothetical protein